MPQPSTPAPIRAVPDPLGPRVRPLSDRPVPASGAYVLAWPRTSLRAFDNPLLDVAVAVADALGLPIFTVGALSERYPCASARHHTFALQGHRDLARGLAERGIASAFHLERPGHRGPHLHTLTANAALVVTDDMPVRPLRGWAERLAARAPCPVWAVDTACVVPMMAIGRAYDRAFQFRQAHEPLRRAFLPPGPDLQPARSELPALPFEPVDLLRADLAELVAQCTIDPTVGPVPDTPGGSAAGYARWRAFVDGGGLRRYARDRSDPARDGVSRMSAYLHWGMVSAARLTREALAHGGPGAEKYLDELLTWRELAYAFCAFGPDVDRLSAIPRWARETLRAHTGDARPALLDLETLGRGRTGDPLWDLAQRSLLRHGELHNNVRMTWGKAILSWTSGPAEALAALIDLNHRYALDGRDPASYGGILWCLGAFDRPFTPERPILGTVRPRPTDGHAERIDLPAYRRRVARPPVADPPTVAVIGLGPAGAFAARTLADHGLAVLAFDKGRGPGGRLSTRRTDHGRFDHGALGLGPLPAPIARYAQAWEAAGLLAAAPPGDPTGNAHVAVPSMNALIKHLLDDLSPSFGVRVTALSRAGSRIVVHADDEEIARVDHLILAVPGPQAAPLIADLAPTLAERVRAICYAPAWVAMAALSGPLPPMPTIVTPDDPDLALISRQDLLPGRAPGARLVLHATRAFAVARLEDDPSAVAADLFAAARRHLDLPEPALLCAHRWRFATPIDPLGVGALVEGPLIVCGDAIAEAGVAAALWSGACAAGRVLGALRDAPAAQPSLFQGGNILKDA